MASTVGTDKRSAEQAAEARARFKAQVDDYRRYAFYFVIAAALIYSAVYFYPG